jgi:hypothetical protein
MIIKKIEITDDKGLAYIQRGRHHIGRWVSIKQNFITKRWQLKNSGLDVHDQVMQCVERDIGKLNRVKL